jgi:predicted RNA binding protein YcfA (HicA-like mRNA interferase family)
VPKLPVIKGSELIAALRKAGFETVRQRGSHVRLRHPDGRVVTIPIHAGEELGRGLLRKILRDADLSVGELINLL